MKTPCLIVFGLVGSTIVVGSASQSRPAPPLTPIEIALKDAYAREFGESIEKPAIHNDPTAGGCKGRDPHLTTTAYLRTSPTSARLLYMYTTLDGGTVVRKASVESVAIPAGTFRVLAVLVGHPATVRDVDVANWEAAQAKINRDHTTFAANRGLIKPIVSFENTNVLVDAGEIAIPTSHWGWPGTHDWAPRCGRPPVDQPFIVPPVLFGWEDVDGDRIPEGLDPTPYGRSQ